MEETKMEDKELLKMIRKCRLADLSDGLDALGLVNVGTMNDKMRPIRPGITFAGFAYTVKLVPTQKKVKECKDMDEYLTELRKWCAGPDSAYPFRREILKGCEDTVLVVDMGGYPGGLWGSEIGAATKLAGISGVVLDGGCRDSEEANIEEVNVFCTRRTFNHVYGRLENGGTNIPIQCAGVTVRCGTADCGRW